MRLLTVVVAAVVLAGCAADRPGRVEERLMPFAGMVLPRPVDPEERARLGFAPPRAPGAILAEIDVIDRDRAEAGGIALNGLPDEERARLTTRISHHTRELARRRIDLVTELEESGYTGERLGALLEDKVRAIRDVWPRGHAPVASYAELRKEVARRHGGTRAAKLAAFEDRLEAITFILMAGLRVHPGDYEAIARVEAAFPDHELAGLLLLEALHRSGDEELKRRWHDWIAAHLPKGSMGARFVARERGFGRPIRLTGETMDGGRFDSADWKGSVILVDFWGMWCRPCREAMPEIDAVHEKYRDRGLRVVGVFCDCEFDAGAAWLKAEPRSVLRSEGTGTASPPAPQSSSDADQTRPGSRRRIAT